MGAAAAAHGGGILGGGGGGGGGSRGEGFRVEEAGDDFFLLSYKAPEGWRCAVEVHRFLVSGDAYTGVVDSLGIVLLSSPLLSPPLLISHLPSLVVCSALAGRPVYGVCAVDKNTVLG